MRLAAIDLGTNTVRLLVVDAGVATGWQTLAATQQVTRLGQGLAASGKLGEEAMQRTAAVVVEYATAAARLATDRLLIVGTSAMRDAGNGAAFAARLAALTGHPVRIITGGEEARLTLRGVRRGLGPLPGVVVVFDIGGGSTEFIRTRDGEVEAAVSLRLGVIPLAERAEPLDAIVAHVRRRLREEIPPAVGGAPVDRLVGTAGTVTTLAALDQELPEYNWRRVHGHVLTRAAVERQRARLEPLAVAEIARLPCLEPGRADLIRPGIAITLAAMDVLGVDLLVVSEYGLREGVLAEALDEGRRP